MTGKFNLVLAPEPSHYKTYPDTTDVRSFQTARHMTETSY